MKITIEIPQPDTVIVRTVRTVKTLGGELEMIIKTTPTIKFADFTADPSLGSSTDNPDQVAHSFW